MHVRLAMGVRNYIPSCLRSSHKLRCGVDLGDARMTGGGGLQRSASWDLKQLKTLHWSLEGKLNLGALIIRIGFGGPLYYDCNKEPTKEYR